MLPILVLALFGCSDGPPTATQEKPNVLALDSGSSTDDIRRDALYLTHVRVTRDVIEQ